MYDQLQKENHESMKYKSTLSFNISENNRDRLFPERVRVYRKNFLRINEKILHNFQTPNRIL